MVRQKGMHCFGAVMLLQFALVAACGDEAAGKGDREGDRAGQCSDGADNDRNGRFDCDDEGCIGKEGCGYCADAWCRMACENVGSEYTGGCVDDECDCDWKGSELPEPCERIGQPQFTSVGQAVIGPEGGSVELDGRTRLDVVQGAWNECWETRIESAYESDGSDYPRGFVPWVWDTEVRRISVGLTTPYLEFEPAPEPQPITISFYPATRPLPGGVACAFRNADGRWQVVFPRKVESGWMVIETAAAQSELWSWGELVLTAVDIDGELRPILEAYLGKDALAEYDSRTDQYLDEMEQIAENAGWDLCPVLEEFARLFQRYRGEAFIDVDDIQKSYGCGACNPLTPAFKEQLAEYAAANFGTDFAISLATGVAGKAIGGAVGEAVDTFGSELLGNIVTIPWSDILGLDCDYDCLEEHETGEIHMAIFRFYASDFLVDVMRMVQRENSCPIPQEIEGDEDWECGDGADNDEDGAVDCLDEGCDGSPRYGCVYGN